MTLTFDLFTQVSDSSWLSYFHFVKMVEKRGYLSIHIITPEEHDHISLQVSTFDRRVPNACSNHRSFAFPLFFFKHLFLGKF